MDTDRVIALLKRRQKIEQTIFNLGQADPQVDAMGIEYMGVTVALDGQQFATVRPIVTKALTDLIHAIDHQLLEQGVTIK